MLDNIFSAFDGLGSVFSVPEPDESGFMQIFRSPLQHLGVALVIDDRVDVIRLFVANPFSNSGPDLLTGHARLEGRPAAGRKNARRSYVALVRRFSVCR